MDAKIWDDLYKKFDSFLVFVLTNKNEYAPQILPFSPPFLLCMGEGGGEIKISIFN